MNRTRLNYTSLGSVGATPFITGVLTAVSRLVGSLTTSVQHYGSLGRAMALDAVATGGIAIYGYASTVVYLADELIGTRNSLKYQKTKWSPARFAASWSPVWRWPAYWWPFCWVCWLSSIIWPKCLTNRKNRYLPSLFRWRPKKKRRNL